jgi:hypothetical protein
MSEVVLVGSFCRIPHASNQIDNHILPPLSRNKKGARLPRQGLFAPGGLITIVGYSVFSFSW